MKKNQPEIPIRALLLLGVFLAVSLMIMPVYASTTELTITKYANDGTTVIDSTTRTYSWMEANLPVLGDGTTRYYSQGPVFADTMDARWNQSEDTNVLEKDNGAVKGTNLKDLCDLVGGMNAGETLTLKASDGFSKSFAYTNVYEYPARQGPMGIVWYQDGQYTGSGFADGFKLVFFADDSVNPWGVHAMGNYDWHESAAPEYWYYYNSGSEQYPTTTGLSVKYISQVLIYSDDAPPAPEAPVAAFSATPLSGNAPLNVQFTGESTGTGSLSYAWDFNNDGITDSTVKDPACTYTQAGTYTVKLTVTNSVSSDDETKTGYITVTSAPAYDIIFDGTVTLTPDETFAVQAYNNAAGTYTVNRITPLGALDRVATQEGFTYNVTDKRWSDDEVLMLDDLGQYLRKNPGYWYAYVNDVYKDGYGNHANGLNVIELANNDQVNFYYAPTNDPSSATAVVKIKVAIGSGETSADWTLNLNGATSTSVTRSYFEQGLACTSSGHQKFWTDTDGNVWGGVPLWVLVGMVDDNPDVGPNHFNFNDDLAAQGYSVKVSSGDGWDTTLASADIARNDGYIVANTMNGQPLPELTSSDKRSWPLHLKGSAVFGGQQVGNITSIELTGLPEPQTEWSLALAGDVTDTISQDYFEEAAACQHIVTWTDTDGNIWEGVPLWDLAGAVDDIETTSHFTFNETRASMGYIIRVSAADGFNATFASADVAHNNGYIVAHRMNGLSLTGTSAPLKLVGPATVSNKQRVGGITRISLEGLPSYPAGDWELKLVGEIGDVIPQPEFEDWASHHSATYTDTNGNVYSGIPLWRLMGWVDDRIPHGSNGFNDAAAAAGYTVIVKAGDGYAKEFASQQIGKNDNFIVANVMNGAPLPTDGSHPPYPLRLVGASATGGNSVGNIAEIQLTDFQTPVEIPGVHIIKYAADGSTIVNETTVDYLWMKDHLTVYGDGTTHYKFEGLTLNPDNIWDPEETYPGGNKIDNVVMGTSIKDLAELVGGMGSGTDIKLVATDGYETTLGYSNIYTNPAVSARQGEAIIAWYADGQYVPSYQDGYRLFFTGSDTGDHVYSQWDMHETVREDLWHWKYEGGVNYPSAAGMSAKMVGTIEIYSTPESDYTLELDGRDIGGIRYTVSKAYLEQAIACQFGANHKATYTDSKGKTWEGMPLWFFAGFVDDADMHSSNAFNDTLATNGYHIVITGSDGYTTTINSQEIIRNSNYIIANSLDGIHIPDTDSSWPLRLTGANITGQSTVKKVAKIQLIPIPLVNSVMTVETMVSATNVKPGDTVTYTYQVKNAGAESLSDIIVTDDKLGVIPGPVSGDINANTLLDPGEEWLYSADATITAPTTSTAQAQGSTPDGTRVMVMSSSLTVSTSGIPAPEFPLPGIPFAIVGALAFIVFFVRRD